MRKHTAGTIQHWPQTPSKSTLSLTSQQEQLGFTADHATRVILKFSTHRRNLSVANTQLWLDLLHTHKVQRPFECAARNPIILAHRVETAALNAPATVTWMLTLGLTQADISQRIVHCPTLLKLPNQTAARVVAAWLREEMGWNGNMVVKVLSKFPKLFCLRPAGTLGPKLDWFLAQGFSPSIEKMLYLHPQLLGYTIVRNEAQLSALQAMGLSVAQVTCMVRKFPVLLMLNIFSDLMQSKMRFLTKVMRKSHEELLYCPVFLGFS